jgi:tripartite-type tricarboxylate transporter receptor subunit TctC
MPPGASPEAITELRQAFDALAKDPEFAEDYKRITQEDPVLVGGAQAQQLIRDAVAGTDPEMKTVLRTAVGLN